MLKLKNKSVEMTKKFIFTKYSKETLDILNNFNRPVKIKEVSDSLNISYSAAKSRLHKLIKLKKIKRAKPGTYYLDNVIIKAIKKPTRKYVILNGLLYRDYKGYSGPMIALYNEVVAKYCNGQYIKIFRKDRDFVLIKSPSYLGNKIHYVKTGSGRISIKSNLLTDKEKEQILNKKQSKRIHILFYPDEWGISSKKIFSTESEKEGELYKTLSKFVSVYKPGRLKSMKADLMIKNGNVDIPIEVTTATFVNDRGKTKSYEILGRLYYAFKWTTINSTPFFIIIDKSWEKSKWLKIEIKFIKDKKVHIIFTNFKNKWTEKVVERILRDLKSFFS